LCFVRFNPGIATKFRYSSTGGKTDEFLHSLNPNRDLENLARDEDQIGYVGNWYLVAIGGTFLAGNPVGYAAWGRQKRKPQAT
jgi:hypothetical protein